VTQFDGHKSLYSDVYYSPEQFWAKYGGAAYRSLKARYDPDGRLLDLYEKTVRRR
jgi:FAD/FMN-containing dehydrogenase